MTTKLVSEDAWSKFAKKHKIDRNKLSAALEKALKQFEDTEDEEPDDAKEKLSQVKELHDRAKEIQDIIGKLLKEKEVKNCKEISDELVDLKGYWSMKEKLLETETDRAREAASKQEDAEIAEDQKEKTLLDRFVAAARTMKGAEGKRVLDVLAIAKRSESTWKSLWYYNYEAIGALVEQPGRYNKMTKATNGKLPFKGDTGGWGEWVIEPFSDKALKGIGGKNATEKDIVTYLKWMDGQVLYSIDRISKAQHASEEGGMTDELNEFAKHITSLAKGRSHIYSAGY